MFEVPGYHLKSRLFDLTQVAFWAGQKAEKELEVKCETLKHRLDTIQVAFSASQKAENEFAVLGDHLKHPFLAWLNSNFGLVKGPKMSSKCYGSTWNTVFTTSPKPHFVLVKRQKMSSHSNATTWNIASSNSPKSPDDNFKHRYLDLTQVAFWAGQEAENEFKVKCEPLKYRFVELTQVAFFLLKRQEMSSKCLETIETSLSLSHPSRILGWSRGRNWVYSAWRQLQRSLSRSHPSCILGWSRGQKISSKCHGSTWNIALSKSSK